MAKNTAADAEAAAENKRDTCFSKEQILGSNKYADRRDILGAILADDKQYTIAEADELLADFMKGKVK